MVTIAVFAGEAQVDRSKMRALSRELYSVKSCLGGARNLRTWIVKGIIAETSDNICFVFLLIWITPGMVCGCGKLAQACLSIDDINWCSVGFAKCSKLTTTSYKELITVWLPAYFSQLLTLFFYLSIRRVDQRDNARDNAKDNARDNVKDNPRGNVWDNVRDNVRERKGLIAIAYFFSPPGRYGLLLVT